MAAEQARVTGDHGGNEETENQANTVRIFVARMNIMTMVMYITEAIIYTVESTMKMVAMVIMKVVNMNENLQGNHHHHHQPENKMVKDDERKTSYAKALN